MRGPDPPSAPPGERTHEPGGRETAAPGFPAVPAALLALVAAGILTPGYLAFRRSEADVRGRAAAELEAVAALKAEQVAEWREGVLADARIAAASRALSSAVAAGRQPRRGDPGETSWLASLRHNRSYAALSLLDASGRPLGSAGPVELDPEHGRGEVEAALRGGEPALSELHLNERGKPHLHLAVPLTSLQGGRPSGALLVRIDPEQALFPLLRSWPTPSESGEILLVRREGDAVEVLSAPRRRQVGPGPLRLPPGSDKPEARAVRGEPGPLVGMDYAGREVFATARAVSRMPWWVVAKIDTQEVLEPMRERAAWLSALTLVALAAVAGGVGFWSRQQRARYYRRQWEAEQERRALQQHLDLVTRHANDVVLLLDEDLRILEANDRAVSTYGWSRDELLRLSIGDLRAPETRGQIADQIRRVREAGGHRFETVHVRRDGSRLPVEASSRFFAIEGRAFYQSIIRDLTEQRSAQAALRESEERFRAVFLEAPIGVALVGVAGAIQGFNRSFQEMLGYDDAELRRMTMFDLSHPDDREMAGRGFERMGKGLLPRLELEKRYLRRGGEVLHSRVRASAVRDASGKFQFAVVMIEDVTAERRAEESARRSEERLQLALEASSDGIWDWDVARDEVYLSTSWLERMGYAPGEIRDGAGMRALFHPEDSRATREALEAHLEGREPGFRAEMRVRTRAGAWRWVENRARVAQRDPEGRPLRVVGAFTDVDDRKRIEARLRLSERMSTVGTLAAGVAHEMNNPLAYVAVNVAFAREALGRLDREPAAGTRDALVREAEQALDEAADGAERVRRIVSDLRTLSHPEDERRAPVDVPAVMRSSLNLAHNEIRHRARLTQDLAPVPPVLASAARLGQVFLNLLVNAAQAIPEGRADENTVRVSTRLDDAGRVEVAVSDTGIGIPPELRDRIFDPFFTTKRIGEGTGLGLAICHGIVSSLGGEILVESESGRGSLFRVLLPAARAPAVAAPGAAAAAARPGRARILVVDDEPRLCRSIERLLAERHDVVAVTAGREALERVEAGESFDLVLCDLMMPEMTGMDLCERLREISPRLADRMVFMTGGAFTERARDFLARSPHRRLEKPFRPEALEALLAELVGSPAEARASPAPAPAGGGPPPS